MAQSAMGGRKAALGADEEVDRGVDGAAPCAAGAGFSAHRSWLRPKGSALRALDSSFGGECAEVSEAGGATVEEICTNNLGACSDLILRGYCRLSSCHPSVGRKIR